MSQQDQPQEPHKKSYEDLTDQELQAIIQKAQAALEGLQEMDTAELSEDDQALREQLLTEATELVNELLMQDVRRGVLRLKEMVHTLKLKYMEEDGGAQ
jgi:hypothetical protein